MLQNLQNIPIFYYFHQIICSYPIFTMCILYPIFCRFHLMSYYFYPIFYGLYPIFTICIQYFAAFISYFSIFIQYFTDFIRYLQLPCDYFFFRFVEFTSNILLFPSDILHFSSNTDFVKHIRISYSHHNVSTPYLNKITKKVHTFIYLKTKIFSVH